MGSLQRHRDSFYPRDVVSGVLATATWLPGWVSVCLSVCLYDWKKGIILTFYNGKGSRTDCRNYRGITLLSVPGKVYAHVLLNRIKAHLHHLRHTEQSGFTPHISTINHIATLNMILQTRREYRKPSWVVYVDFQSARLC